MPQQPVSALTASPAWQALAAHQREMAPRHLVDLFAQEPGRARHFAIELEELFFDFSKHRITAETHRLLLQLAHQADLSGWMARLFAGEKINHTEARAALHMALRAGDGAFPRAEASHKEAVDVMPMVRATRQRMLAYAEALASAAVFGTTGQPIRLVVNLGVGGSDLGPRMAVRALRAYCRHGVEVRFASNVDPSDLDVALEGADPATTLFLITSKSFTTVETISNARRARAWLEASLGQKVEHAAHFSAVTAAPERAQAFGIASERIFPMWDWVGGRYSLWSAVGLPIAIAAGTRAFEEMLEGGRTMDEHFISTPLERNLPVIMGLLSVWYSAFFNAETCAVLPYCEDLREFPAYLQQLQMESNGKRVNRSGQPIEYATSPILWGAAGTVSQHSFHQLLHQGTHLVPVEFIVPLHPSGSDQNDGDAAAQKMLVANALAQGAALMSGNKHADPHRASPGNNPSSTLLLNALTPRTLGMLIALYEHKVFVESVIVDINPFDQWGVELGKTLAGSIQDGQPAGLDASTRNLMSRVNSASLKQP